MKKQRFLTLEDLGKYYSENFTENTYFSSKETGKSIVVQVPAKISFEADDDDDEEERPDLFKITLYAAHTGDNPNMSNIEKDVYEAAQDTFANKPILAYIHEVDGQYEFYTHNMHDEDGELVYDEVPVGVVPSENNFHFETNEENGKEYVVIEGYIYELYSKAAEIIRREGTCYCSMEINILEMAVSPKESAPIRIKSMEFNGITLLGKRPDGSIVQPGMTDAHVEFENFSKENNSLFSQEIVQKLDELKEKLDDLSNFEIDIKPKKKGGEKVSKFEELLKKYNKTEEDVTFEYEGLSDEELEAKFAEAFEESGEGEGADGAEPATDPVSDDSGEEFTAEDDDASTEDSEESGEEGGEDTGAETKFSKTFELSHDDIRCGLYALLAPFEEEDNDWYGINAVYDDYFIYSGWFDASHIFKQGYTREGDEISLSGERIHLNCEFLTDNELTELNAMRSNYSEISEKLAKYEAEPQKVEKIQSEEYSMIRDTEEYRAIANDHFDLSVEDITKTLDEVVLKYAKANKLNYAANETTTKKTFFAINPSTGVASGKYDSLFSK